MASSVVWWQRCWSSSQASWLLLGSITVPPKPATLGWALQLTQDRVMGTEGGASVAEIHSVPGLEALSHMEQFFLSLRHLLDGDLIERKKGLCVGIP